MTDLAILDLGKLVRPDLMQLAFAGLKPQTMKLYAGDWERFLEYSKLTMSGFFELEKIDAALVLNHFLTHLAKLGRKPSTRSRAKQAICSVVDRLYAADAAPWTLAKLKIIETPEPGVDLDLERFTRKDYLQLLSATRRDGTPPGVRDVAVLLLLHDSALRRREVATLRLEDYEAEKARVQAWWKGKDKGVRNPVPLHPTSVIALNAWLKLRDPTKAGLFTPFDHVRRTHDEFWEEDVNRIVRLRCRKAGIVEVGPHQLRHAGITHAARKGAAPLKLKSFARHKSFDVTMNYIHTVAEDARSVTNMVGEIEEDD